MKLGTVLADGSILLDDDNIKYREAMTGHYQRIRQTPKAVQFLGKQGFIEIMSSFISAAKTEGDDLYIRFHNAAVYVYYGFAYIFDKFMMANSKGQFFVRKIRPTKNYKKIGYLETPSGTPVKLDDDVMFEKMEFNYIKEIVKELEGAVLELESFEKDGIDYKKFIITHNNEVIKILLPMMIKH